MKVSFTTTYQALIPCFMKFDVRQSLKNALTTTSSECIYISTLCCLLRITWPLDLHSMSFLHITLKAITCCVDTDVSASRVIQCGCDGDVNPDTAAYHLFSSASFHLWVISTKSWLAPTIDAFCRPPLSASCGPCDSRSVLEFSPFASQHARPSASNFSRHTVCRTRFVQKVKSRLCNTTFGSRGSWLPQASDHLLQYRAAIHAISDVVTIGELARFTCHMPRVQCLGID